jgi:hypothetical protein
MAAMVFFLKVALLSYTTHMDSNMEFLGHHQGQVHLTQIVTLLLVAPPLGQLTLSAGIDVGVEVGGIIEEASHVEIELTYDVGGQIRLDIGLARGERLRLRFKVDSPLKWQRFLQLRLRIHP